MSHKKIRFRNTFYLLELAANIVISHSSAKVVKLFPLNVTVTNYAVITPQMAAQMDAQKKTK
ncbi:hypothetical protein [Bacillus taeanensis]|uniref:hypothetical protein n=1 Tax=Bacillus taeanensis TaxID=273032 RepID=UPI00115955BB|nr:hypothetical protein [Bacillus taeanensis]